MIIRAAPIEAIRRSRVASRLGAGAGLVLVATGLAYLVSAPATFRTALVASVLVLIFGVWALRPTALLYLILLWTVVLGILRRLVSYGPLGVPTEIDLLLIVAPVAFVLLAATAFRAGAMYPRTRLSQAMLGLAVLIGLGALNPLQGSPTAGVAALVFFVPVLAFWIGRELVDDHLLQRLLALLAVLALPVVAYGFYQLILGFPPWDTAWIENQGYAALNVGGVIRPFGSFSAASEYAYFLAIAAIVWGWMRPARASRLVALAAVTTLVVALIYEASRGILFILVGTTALLFAASRGFRLRGAMIAAAAAVLLLPVVVSSVVPNFDPDAKGTNALLSHQVRGISDPASSTLPLHFSLVVDGIQSAFSNPVGQGISLVTIAGKKLGGGNQNTESDISNVGVALGLPGIALYLFIVWTGFSAAYRLAVLRRDPLTYAVLGLLGVTFFQWLNGGHYAVAYLPWLALGWIDRQSRALPPAQSDDPPAA